jgi:hypothetical protein
MLSKAESDIKTLMQRINYDKKTTEATKKKVRTNVNYIYYLSHNYYLNYIKFMIRFGN